MTRRDSAMTVLLWAWTLLVVSNGAGCGRPESVSLESAAASEVPAKAKALASPADTAADPLSGQPAAVDRKIVYTADLNLIVEDLSAMVAEVRSLTDAAGGFIGDVSETGRVGSYRSATLVLRVPSSQYAPLLGRLSELGEVESRRETADDVTERYVDLEARIANKRREETRLIELLEDATGQLADVLAVEKELSRVREEVERYEGRLNVLRDQVELSTITVSAEERVRYEPEKPRTLGDQSASVWHNSVRRVGDFFRRLVLEFVAFVPWLVVWIPLGMVVWLIIRTVRRRRRGTSRARTPHAGGAVDRPTEGETR